MTRAQFDAWCHRNFLNCRGCKIVGVIEKFVDGKCPLCGAQGEPLTEQRVSEILSKTKVQVWHV